MPVISCLLISSLARANTGFLLNLNYSPCKLKFSSSTSSSLSQSFSSLSTTHSTPYPLSVTPYALIWTASAFLWRIKGEGCGVRQVSRSHSLPAVHASLARQMGTSQRPASACLVCRVFRSARAAIVVKEPSLGGLDQLQERTPLCSVLTLDSLHLLVLRQQSRLPKAKGVFTMFSFELYFNRWRHRLSKEDLLYGLENLCAVFTRAVLHIRAFGVNKQDLLTGLRHFVEDTSSTGHFIDETYGPMPPTTLPLEWPLFADEWEQRYALKVVGDFVGCVSLYVHRNRRLIRDGSPGRPPPLSHSSGVLCRLLLTTECLSPFFLMKFSETCLTLTGLIVLRWRANIL